MEFLRGEIVSGDETKPKQAEEWNKLYLCLVEVCLELKELPQLALKYTRLLRNLEDYHNKIAINESNYSERLKQIDGITKNHSLHLKKKSSCIGINACYINVLVHFNGLELLARSLNSGRCLCYWRWELIPRQVSELEQAFIPS